MGTSTWETTMNESVEWANSIVKPGAGTALKRAALYKLVDYLMADPERNIKTIMERSNKLLPKNLFGNQRRSFTEAIEQENNWYQLLLKLARLNPDVIPQLMKTFVVDANLLAWPQQEANRERLRCNVPWAILLDPTSACNLSCTGC